MKNFVGIDISKETFDVYFEQEPKGCYIKLHQIEADYKVLLHLIGKDAICIMEATGNYHLGLASFLYQSGIKVVAENPLKIKRFPQMSLERTKTDKANSKLIYEYGQLIIASKLPIFWQSDKIEIGHLKQYDTVRHQLVKQRTALTNSEEALSALTSLNDEVTKVLKGMLIAIEQAIKQLDKGMLSLVKEHYFETYDLVPAYQALGLKQQP